MRIGTRALLLAALSVNPGAEEEGRRAMVRELASDSAHRYSALQFDELLLEASSAFSRV
jgi:hypothetical protein